MRYLLILLLVLAACSPAPEAESTLPPLPATEVLPATEMPSPTVAPTVETQATATPMTVVDLPAIELLSGAADSCVNEEAYGKLLAFDVRYYEVTTANRLHYRLEDSQGNVLDENNGSGENKDGEEGWGFYPLAYEVPANSLLTFTLEVYQGGDEEAIQSSTSSITYNCTTGEVTESSFERSGQ